MPEPLCAERRAEMRARCDAATLDNWRHEQFPLPGCDRIFHDVTHGPVDDSSERYSVLEELTAENAEFIAHARADLPACLTEIDRLEARLEKAEAVLPHPDLCTLSLIWNEFAGGRVREDTEQRVNEWLKARIAKEKH